MSLIRRRINGDPSTNLYSVRLKVTTPSGSVLHHVASIGGSNEKQAEINAVACYQSWYPKDRVEVDR